MTTGASNTIPRSKLNRALIALLVIQVAILVISRLGGSEPSSTKPKKLMADLDTSKVIGVEIVDANKNKRVELKKQGGKWLLASGGGYPTKKDKVSDFLAKLPALTAGPPVSEVEAHQRKFEVAKDKFSREVTLTLEGKKDPMTFFIGSSPGLKRVHLRFAGKKAIYAAGELSTWDVGTAAQDWVDSQYYKIAREEIVSLTVKNEQGEIKLAKGEGDKWQLASDGVAPTKGKEGEGPALEQSEVDSLLGAASSMTMQEPVGTKIEPSFGLEPPKALVTVVTEKVVKEGAGTKDKAAASRPAAASQPSASQPTERRVRTTYTLKIGAKKGDDFYAKASTSDFVVTVGSWAAETFTNKKAADLLEKKDEDDKKKDKEGE